MDIRPITPALANDYMTLFDNAFSDNPHWAGCFCAFYDDTRSVEEWNASRSDFASRNRDNRQNTISEGKAYGLLAYESDRPIGWVNAGLAVSMETSTPSTKRLTRKTRRWARSCVS